MARIGMNGALIEARRLCRIPKRTPASVHRSQRRHNMRERQDSHLTQPKSCPVSWVHFTTVRSMRTRSQVHIVHLALVMRALSRWWIAGFRFLRQRLVFPIVFLCDFFSMWVRALFVTIQLKT